jgi:predicted RNA-binding Zn-ribbon protein involved in translation (DUF1610 family)
MSTPNSFPCEQCGAALQYKPGEAYLQCPYCQFKNAITAPKSAAAAAAPGEELDFLAFAAKAEAGALEERKTWACKACGASSHAGGQVTAFVCPFCGSGMVQQATARLLKPRGLLPFKVDDKAARRLFESWIAGLWFAPNALKRLANVEGRLAGIYVPYWTFDAETTTRYTGERGEHYTETERYTEGGETKTRQVTKTRWYAASGVVADAFDDVLVMASGSLPRAYAEKLEPWDLGALVPYEEAYLAGFRAECYQVGLKQGYTLAQERMQPVIRQSICRDIGGDEQRILSAATNYADVTFKHLLLPIWLAAYRYHDKTFRFLVNGRTGEVQGERPYSAVKIFFAVVLALIVLGVLFSLYQSGQRYR